MADLTNSLGNAVRISGAKAVAVIDIDEDRTIFGTGCEHLDLDIAAAVHGPLLRTAIRCVQMTGTEDEIEDMVFSHGDAIHILRPIQCKGGAGLFFLLALDRKTSSLAIARRKLAEIEQELIL